MREGPFRGGEGPLLTRLTTARPITRTLGRFATRTCKNCSSRRRNHNGGYSGPCQVPHLFPPTSRRVMTIIQPNEICYLSQKSHPRKISRITAESFVQQQPGHVSGVNNRIPYTIHAYLTAVIFNGSCGPLYSSPRTRGVKAPVLILLICG